ncbi:unnamed protein product [Durusdinium trenchii]|uniref:Uncharacterized protein n=1 Tax=Durusdinium trenchii TaxID=1381693 RepID=A0ABP0P4I4_9DINO
MMSGVSNDAILDHLAEQHPELPWAVHEDLCAEVQQLLATMVSEKAERLRSNLQSKQKRQFEQAGRLVQERYEKLVLGLRALDAANQKQDSPLYQQLVRDVVAEPFHAMLALRLQEATGTAVEVTAANRKSCMEKLSEAEKKPPQSLQRLLAALKKDYKESNQTKKTKEGKDGEDGKEKEKVQKGDARDISELYHAAADDSHIYCRKVDKKREKAAAEEQRAALKERLKDADAASDAVMVCHLGLQLALSAEGVSCLVLPSEVWALRLAAGILKDEEVQDLCLRLCDLCDESGRADRRMGQSPCSRCEEDDGDSTNREPPMSTAERQRYEEEFERHVQAVLRQGAKEVWCSQCGIRLQKWNLDPLPQLPHVGNRAVSLRSGSLRGRPSQSDSRQGSHASGPFESFTGVQSSAKQVISGDPLVLAKKGRKPTRPRPRPKPREGRSGTSRGEVNPSRVRVMSASSGWCRGRPSPETKDGHLAGLLTRALGQALQRGSGTWLDVGPLQCTVRECCRDAHRELARGELQKRETLQCLGLCAELLDEIATSACEALRLQNIVQNAERRGWFYAEDEAALRAERQLVRIEASHQELGQALAKALENLGVGRSPCCDEGHAMDAIPLPSLRQKFERCMNCGRESEDFLQKTGLEAHREPWWKCRKCCTKGHKAFYCFQCGRDVHGSSSCALLANLVPTVNWRACMKRSKSRLPGGQGFTVNGIKDKATPQSPVLSRPVSFVPAELFQKMPQQEQGQEQSQGDQQRQNRQEIQLPRPLDPPACSFGESKPSSAPDADISAHGARLGAPSPRSEHTCGPSRSFVATIFDPDGMDGQGFFTFLTQDDASVVSTWSEKSEKGGIFQGMALSVKEIWSPPIDRSDVLLETRADAVEAPQVTWPREPSTEGPREPDRIITRRPKLPISPGLENVLLAQGGETNLTPDLSARAKQRAISTRRTTEAAEADDIAKELVARPHTAPRSGAKPRAYVVAPQEMFQGSLQAMDVPIWEQVVSKWRQRINMAEKTGHTETPIPAAPVRATPPLQLPPRLRDLESPVKKRSTLDLPKVKCSPDKIVQVI